MTTNLPDMTGRLRREDFGWYLTKPDTMKCFACSELTNFLPICIHPTQASLAQNFLTPVHVRAMGIFGIYCIGTTTTFTDLPTKNMLSHEAEMKLCMAKVVLKFYD